MFVPMFDIVKLFFAIFLKEKNLLSGDCNLGEKNLYDVLGCSQEASIDELKQAYHSKILEFHPDKNKNSSDSSCEFQEIHSAWKVLGDPILKKEYDVKWQQENFQAQSALIYAKVNPSELEITEDENILSYQCRCGNHYLVGKSDLEQTNCVVHVPCQDCTFVIAIET